MTISTVNSGQAEYCHRNEKGPTMYLYRELESQSGTAVLMWISVTIERALVVKKQPQQGQRSIGR